MAQLFATIIWAFVTVALFRLNREAGGGTSKALWIPSFWLFLSSSRNLAEWLHYSPGSGEDRYLEGNPLDRAVLSLALALGVIVLISRGQRVGKLLRSNLPILLYFLYCVISVIWSDFPLVSFKRWFRASGDFVMVLIILSEFDWLSALRRLLFRLGLLVIPLSVLFIRYFPEFGRAYSHGGAPSWTGVGTDKNALGMICLIYGLAAIFFFLQLYREDPVKNRRPLIAYGVLIVMAFYLLWAANSATAVACFFLAGSAMVLTLLFPKFRKPALLHFMVITVLAVPFSAMFLGLGSSLVEDLGRDTTFTGRTAIWHYAPTLVSNPLIGTGFESFWVGQRLHDMETLIEQGVNQAHNGYIEIYLNLGYVGLFFLAILLVVGYRRTVAAARWQTEGGSLRLAYFIVAVAYNFSEGGFKMMHPVWIFFLLSIAIGTQTPNSVRLEMSPGQGTRFREPLPETDRYSIPETVITARFGKLRG